MNYHTISACMIVKNEEKLLSTCLKSIKDYVDEIIIVDTGSTDQTVPIAESFGAQVYHHPWENNFSKHRNQSFGYAKGDWIFYIDADEELLPGSGDALRSAIITDEDVDALVVTLQCIFNQGGSTSYNNAIRVFRNHRGLRYEGRIHNYIVGVKKTICTPIHIFHHGYDLDEETRMRKFKRTTELLIKEIQEEPENPRPHHFLGASYLSESMFEDAAKETMEAIRLYEKRGIFDPNLLWSIYNASSAYFHMGEIGNAEKLSKKGIGIYPNHIDAHYMLSLVAYEKKDRKTFEHHMQRYLEAKNFFEKNPSEFGELVHNTFGSEWMLYLLNGFLFISEGRHESAKEAFQKGREICPVMFLYHSKLGSYYHLSDTLLQAEEHYLKAIEARPEDTHTIRALSDVYEKLGRYVNQTIWLEKLIKIDPEFPNGRFDLGLAYMELGQFDRAISLFKRMQAQCPQDHRAKVNEAICLRGIGDYDASIRLSLEIETSEKDELLVIVSNIAHCHVALGHRGQAVKWFDRLAEESPEALEPPVYLSMLYMEQKDIEASVSQCSKLLSLLGMEQNMTLNRLVELGELYFNVGCRLYAMKKEGLAGICFDIGAALGYHNSKNRKEIEGALL
jgi:tetratricopeptide (TPR) repeat protein